MRPPDEIAVADHPWQPRGPAAGEHHVPAGVVQLLSELAARLAAAYDEHPSGRQRLLVSVVVDVDLRQVVWERLGGGGPMLTLKGAGREDDCVRSYFAGGRVQHEPSIWQRIDRRDVDLLLHRGVRIGRVALQVRHDLVARHEPIWVRPVVVPVGQLHRPVGRDKAEAVPQAAPRLPDPAALEDDVLDSQLRQLVTRREPSLAGSDDRDAHGTPAVRARRTRSAAGCSSGSPGPASPSRRAACRGFARGVPAAVLPGFSSRQRAGIRFCSGQRPFGLRALSSSSIASSTRSSLIAGVSRR